MRHDLKEAMSLQAHARVDESSGSCFHLGPVVQRVDNAMHRINHYPVDSIVCFVSTYLLDSDLSGG